MRIVYNPRALSALVSLLLIMTAAPISVAGALQATNPPASAPKPIPPVNPVPSGTKAGDQMLWSKDKDICSGTVTTTSQNSGAFGFIVTAGRLYSKISDPAGTPDDVAMSAIHESNYEPGTGTLANAGHVYVYKGGSTLLQSTPAMLTPGVNQTDAQFGYRGVVIGTMKPADDYNLLWVASYYRDYVYTGGSVSRVGAVDAFKLYGADCSTYSQYNTSIFKQAGSPMGLIPPPKPGSLRPSSNQSFGHSMAIADVDGNGKNDLIVGAPVADSGEGLVYIFFDDVNSANGIDIHTNGSGATSKVMILAPPPVSSGFSGPAAGNFGYWVIATDLNNDGCADIIVGEPKFSSTAGSSGTPTYTGRIQVYSGASIPRPGTTSYPNNVYIYNNSPINGTPAQTILPPMINGQYQSGGGMGWYHFFYDFDNDGSLDLAAHEETRQWPGIGTNLGKALSGASANTTAASSANAAGSLCFYRNISGTGAPQFEQLGTDQRPRRWIFSPSPEPSARYGHHIEPIQWKDSGSPGTVYNALLVNEPDSTTSGKTHSGRVHLYWQAQINDSNITNGDRYALDTVWTIDSNDGYLDFTGSGFTDGPQDDENFGRWLAVGNFSGGTGVLQQFILSAGNRNAPDNSGAPRAVSQAGCAAQLLQP